jgi:HPt (histidine-containing phosphotransfer) domain-containing protein
VEALGRENFKELALLAHNWKGTGTSFGFPEITRLGTDLELAANELNHDSVSRQIADLATYISAAGRQLAAQV